MKINDHWFGVYRFTQCARVEFLAKNTFKWEINICKEIVLG